LAVLPLGHRALAEATDAEADPDRRAWHLAQATPGPGEAVAAELERSAGRAQARGGVAAAAAFLQRAVALTVDPARRAERALAAAQASFQAGVFDSALGLMATAEAGPLDDFQRARVDLLRGHIAVALGSGDAAPLLLRAARRLEPFDLDLARETYLIAWGATVSAGDLEAGRIVGEIARARLGPAPAAWISPSTRPATRRACPADPRGTRRWDSDPAASSESAARDRGGGCPSLGVDGHGGQHRRVGRSGPAGDRRESAPAGPLAQLPIHLSALALARAWFGDLAGAASLVAEIDSVVAATGSRLVPGAALRLRALQGMEAETSALIASVLERDAAGAIALYAHWAAAVLYNGLARYQEAAASAQEATSSPFEVFVAVHALPELVEAAARERDTELAREALERLTDTTQPAGTDWALGIEARSRALASDGAAADEQYREAIERLGRTQLRPELARTHLVYGEWLRREGRRVDARELLRTAHDLFVAIGMEAFAERAGRELVATGEKVRKRSPETLEELTAQEEQIARLARDGLSNPRSGRSCSSAPARWSGICARCSPSSTSAPAGSFAQPCPRAAGPSCPDCMFRP
jgi:tetratricopeptide (TPR) repeat protein